MSSGEDTPKPNPDTKALGLDLLAQEYGIIQGKMDKIGDFRFKVRGWALTLVLGLFVAAISFRASPGMAALGSVLLTFLFWLLEEEQNCNYRVLRGRAGSIEQKLQRLHPHPPGIVNAYAREFRAARTQARFTKAAVLRKLTSNTGRVFYIVLLLISALCLLNSPATSEMDHELQISPEQDSNLVEYIPTQTSSPATDEADAEQQIDGAEKTLKSKNPENTVPLSKEQSTVDRQDD